MITGMSPLVQHFFDEYFVHSSEWVAMCKNVENSRWHREDNTAVHTKMLIDWYNANVAANRDEHQRKLAELAMLFHDTGKPVMRVDKYSEERGHYNSFADHERASARVFESCMMAYGGEFMKLLKLTPKDVFIISFIIENHLPYKYMADAKRYAVNAKRRSMKTTIVNSIKIDDVEYSMNVFYDVLRADQHGRISDNGEVESQEVEDWIAAFDKEKLTTFDLDHERIVLMVVGPNTQKVNELKDKFKNFCNHPAEDEIARKTFDRNTCYLKFYELKNGHPADGVGKAKEFARNRLNEYNQFEQVQFGLTLDSLKKGIVYVHGNFSSPKSRLPFLASASRAGFKTSGIVQFDEFNPNEDANLVLPMITYDFDVLQIRANGEVSNIDW